MAAFIDGGRTIDRTNWSTTYTSYYPFGGAIALALDLTLREQTDGRVTLDDFMRAMWRKHGKPGGAAQVTSTIRIPSPTPRRARRGGGDRRSPATSSPATSRATRSPTTSGCSRAPGSCCASAPRDGPGSATLLSKRGSWRLRNGGGTARGVAGRAEVRRVYAAGHRTGRRDPAMAGRKSSSGGDLESAVQARQKPGDTIAIHRVGRSRGDEEDLQRNAGRRIRRSR